MRRYVDGGDDLADVAEQEHAVAKSIIARIYDSPPGQLFDLVTELRGGSLPDEATLFSESTTRFVIEVKTENAPAVQELFAGLPLTPLGRTVKEARLRIVGTSGEWVVWTNLAELKEAWQKPLRW